MKILYTCTYSSGISGVWSRVQSIAGEMIKRGHEVYVFSSDFEAGTMRKVQSEEIVEGIKCYRFPARVFLSKNALDFSISAGRMREKLREIRPNVIDCQTYRHSEGNIISKESVRLGIPCFLTTHAPFVPVGVRGIWLSTLTWFYDLIFAKAILKRFKKIIAISKWEYPYLNMLGIGNGKIEYIPNGIPSEFFEKERAFGKKVRKILFFGRVAPVKELEVLLEAWALIEEENKDIVIEIAGPVELEYKNKLEELIEKLGIKNVKFRGAVFDLDKKRNIFDSAEIYVLPSKREGMPQTLIEAMSRGNIVIASDIIASKDLINDGKNGFLFKRGNEKELGKIMEHVIKNYEKLGKMRENSIKLSSSFKWPLLADRLEKLYKKA